MQSSEQLIYDYQGTLEEYKYQPENYPSNDYISHEEWLHQFELGEIQLFPNYYFSNINNNLDSPNFFEDIDNKYFLENQVENSTPKSKIQEKESLTLNLTSTKDTSLSKETKNNKEFIGKKRYNEVDKPSGNKRKVIFQVISLKNQLSGPSTKKPNLV